MKKRLFPPLLFPQFGLLVLILFSLPLWGQKSRQDGWARQLQQYVSPDGQVDYAAWKKDQGPLNNYILSLEAAPPQSHWKKNEKLAFWINAYNALTVQLILNNFPLQSIKDLEDPWDTPLFTTSDQVLSLGEIEHEILRKLDEPRIHFAINCASASCPKLAREPYTPRGLDEQLKRATAAFLCDTTRNQLEGETLRLSKIFLWFSEDFGGKKELLAFLRKHTQLPIPNEARIRYLKYNWALND